MSDHPGQLGDSPLDADPVYRTEIRETDQGWFWRVEVDVRNGRAWSGEAESYREATRQVARRLLAASDLRRTLWGRNDV